METFEETHILNAFSNSMVGCAYLDGKLLFRVTMHEEPDFPVYALADLKNPQFEQIDLSIGIALEQTKQRPLQATEKPGEYYIAVSNYLDTPFEDNCSVGRFNVHDLSFEPMLTLEGIVLNNDATWVDAENKMIYSAYEGKLVEFSYTDP